MKRRKVLSNKNGQGSTAAGQAASTPAKSGAKKNNCVSLTRFRETLDISHEEFFDVKVDKDAAVPEGCHIFVDRKHRRYHTSVFLFMTHADPLFFKAQLVTDSTQTKYWLFQRWGEIDKKGAYITSKCFKSQDAARRSYETDSLAVRVINKLSFKYNEIWGEKPLEEFDPEFKTEKRTSMYFQPYVRISEREKDIFDADNPTDPKSWPQKYIEDVLPFMTSDDDDPGVLNSYDYIRMYRTLAVTKLELELQRVLMRIRTKPNWISGIFSKATKLEWLKEAKEQGIDMKIFIYGLRESTYIAAKLCALAEMKRQEKSAVIADRKDSEGADSRAAQQTSTEPRRRNDPVFFPPGPPGILISYRKLLEDGKAPAFNEPRNPPACQAYIDFRNAVKVLEEDLASQTSVFEKEKATKTSPETSKSAAKGKQGSGTPQSLSAASAKGPIKLSSEAKNANIHIGDEDESGSELNFAFQARNRILEEAMNEYDSDDSDTYDSLLRINALDNKFEAFAAFNSHGQAGSKRGAAKATGQAKDNEMKDVDMNVEQGDDNDSVYDDEFSDESDSSDDFYSSRRKNKKHRRPKVRSPGFVPRWRRQAQEEVKTLAAIYEEEEKTQKVAMKGNRKGAAAPDLVAQVVVNDLLEPTFHCGVNGVTCSTPAVVTTPAPAEFWTPVTHAQSSSHSKSAARDCSSEAQRSNVSTESLETRDGDDWWLDGLVANTKRQLALSTRGGSEDALERSEYSRVVKPRSKDSSRYFRIPSVISVSPGGDKVAIRSYINNLHPDRHRNLYKSIAHIFSKSLLAFERLFGEVLNVGEHIPDNFATQSLDYFFHQDELPSLMEKLGLSGDEAAFLEELNFLYPPLELKHSTWTHIGGGKNRFRLPKRVKLSGRDLKVFVKLETIQLTPPTRNAEGTQKASGGSNMRRTRTKRNGTSGDSASPECVFLETPWTLAGVGREERAVATGIYFFDVENIETAENQLSFRTFFEAQKVPGVEEGDVRSRNYQHIEDKYGMPKGARTNQFRGGLPIQEGQFVAFLHNFQHKLGPISLSDKSKPGHCKMLIFQVVDPEDKDGKDALRRGWSTANIAPQQREWHLDLLRENLTAMFGRKNVDDCNFAEAQQRIFDFIHGSSPKHFMRPEDAEDFKKLFKHETKRYLGVMDKKYEEPWSWEGKMSSKKIYDPRGHAQFFY